jgi:hypothetical protein
MQYSYDASGRLITMLSHVWNNNAWVPMNKDSIGYSATGKFVSWTSSIFYAASGVWKNSTRDLSYYNSSDIEVALVRQADNGGPGWESLDSTVHVVLNAAGLPLVDSVYVNGGTGWTFTQRNTNTYTPANQLSTSFWERITGGMLSNYYREYFFYDSYDQLTRHYAETWSGSSWSKAYTSEQRYYYEPYTTTAISSTENRKSIRALLYPLPASTEASLTLHLASPQQLNVSLHDNQGRLLKTWQELAPAGAYTKKIPVGSLASGTYILSVESTQGSWTGALSVAH